MKCEEDIMGQPLFLHSVMQEKIWGGTRLKEEFGYEIPSDHVGEFWAISAHPHGVSKVANGPYEGMGLDQLYQEHRELFSNRKEPVFPLLTKILDANDWLSVQVHPDDTYAMEHEGELGKTECWYVIAADEGSEIIYGHNAKSKEELRQQIEDKNWDALLTKVPVKAGDFFYVPSGTMHAIGSGILILETQQSSDTTYRVYDFDRKDDNGNLRELHLEKSIDVLNIGEPANSRPVTVKADDLRSTLLVSNDFFAVYKWEITGKVDFEKTADYSLLSVLDGQGKLTVDGKDYPIQKGSHFILRFCQVVAIVPCSNPRRISAVRSPRNARNIRRRSAMSLREGAVVNWLLLSYWLITVFTSFSALPVINPLMMSSALMRCISSISVKTNAPFLVSAAA